MLINVIQHLKMTADGYRKMSAAETHVIPEQTLIKYAKLADEFELAADVLLKLTNDGFKEGVLIGLKSLVEDYKTRKNIKNN